LFRGESFGRAERHVAGIVDNHVDMALLGDNLGNAGLDLLDE
jgi:hypothetical protein